MSGTMKAGAGETHVVVSDTMRGLYRSSRARRAETAPPSPRAERQTAAASEAASGTALRHKRRIRLRRDGRRPLSFEGWHLLGRSLETVIDAAPDSRGARVRHVFDIYQASSGELVACLAMLVPEGVAARPVHTVATVDSPDALATLLRAHDPAAGFNPCSVPTRRGHDAPWDRLRSDVRALVLATVSAAPVILTRDNGE